MSSKIAHHNESERRTRFAAAFGMPKTMLPWVDLVASREEIDMVLALRGGAMPADRLAEEVGLPLLSAEEILYRAHCREVVNRQIEDGVETYTSGSFYRRLDVMATFEFESYSRVPAEIRQANHEWYLVAYEQYWQPAIEQIREDPDYLPTVMDTRLSNRDVLLLKDALDMVEAASLHVMYPCGCQGLVVPGEEPIEASIRLDEQAQMVLDRGQGRQVTKEEMKETLVASTKAGRVITGLNAWRQHENWGMGLCDPTISYSFCVGAEIGLAKKWPRSHHLAAVEWGACTDCGDCVASCPFVAFELGDKDRITSSGMNKALQYDQALCWGCGLCVDACPEGAIAMEPLQA